MICVQNIPRTFDWVLQAYYTVLTCEGMSERPRQEAFGARPPPVAHPEGFWSQQPEAKTSMASTQIASR